MKFKMTPYLTDEMPHGWEVKTPLDALIDANALFECPTATIEADTPEEGLSALFRVCNIGEEGAYVEAYRGAKNRSLSVGDVVSVRPADAPDTEDSTFYVVMPLGFETIDWDDVYELLTAHATWYEDRQRRREEWEAAQAAKTT